MSSAVALRKRHDLVTVQDLQRHFRRAHKVEVPAATIRQWASRKKITTHGFQRARFDLREVEDYAADMGWIAN